MTTITTSTAPVRTAAAASTAATGTATATATSALPLPFESALEKMLRAFGEDRDPSRDPSLSTIAGAALLLLQKVEQSLASIAGAAAGGPQHGLAVTVGLDPKLHDDVVGKLDALSSVVSTDERHLTGVKQHVAEFADATRAKQAETEHRLARLDEHLGHLRARQETLVSGAAELAETVRGLEVVILREHARFTEEIAALGQRIEPLEHRRKGPRATPATHPKLAHRDPAASERQSQGAD